MSGIAHRRVSIALTFFFVLMVFPPVPSDTLAQSGTPQSDQTEIVPTETTASEPTDVSAEPTATETPVEATATDVPDEPIATDVPIEPTATDIPSEPTPTETSEPEFAAAAEVAFVAVSFGVCGDDERAGTS